jgi:transmembrane sensor
MNFNEDRIRTGIAEQAAEWFVANEEGPLDAADSAALAAWLRASPAHIEEFLGVSAIAGNLKEARTHPDYSLEAILARARAEEMSAAVRDRPSRRWFTAAVTAAAAACALLSLGLFLMRKDRPIERLAAQADITTLRLETRHGEQMTRVMADRTVLHLDTDSAVSIRYDKNERRVVLIAGQADFAVAHEAGRPFRVIAGLTEIVDLGTQFDVRLEHDSTVITVVEGQVTVGLSPVSERLGPALETLGANSAQRSSPIPLGAGQQIRVSEAEWPAAPIAVDAQRATAWLRRQIVFDHEPLESVAAEYNRYSSKPIEIATPALRGLQVSGVFATDDTEAFVAFLRSLKGVRVEVAESRIRVSRN